MVDGNTELLGYGMQPLLNLPCPDRDELLHAVDSALLTAAYTPEGALLAVSDKFLAVLGWSAEDMAGKRLKEFFVPRHGKRMAGRIDRAMRAGTVFSQRVEWKTASGGSVWLESAFVPIVDQAGGLLRIVQVASDVTRHALVERRKLEVYQRLSQVADKTSSAVVITDGDFQVQFVNAGFCRMFGYARREMFGKRPTLVFGPEEERILGQLRGAMGRTLSLRVEEIAYGKNGKRVWVALLCNAIHDHDGRVLQHVFVFTDITDTKIHEHLQQTALEALARDMSASDALTLICRDVEGLLDGVGAAVWEVDDGTLSLLAFPAKPRGVGIARNLPVRPGEGPVCDSLYCEDSVAVQDLARSSYSRDAKGLYAGLGVAASLSRAIRLADGRAVGAVSLYYSEPCEPGALHGRVCDILARTCAHVMEWWENRTLVREQALSNPVTGLPNLHALLSDSRLEGLERFAVLCVNIDHFNRINTMWGYRAGNEMLKIIAARLFEVSDGRAVLGHLFGDEFVLIAPECDTNCVLDIGKRVQAAFAAPCAVNGSEVLIRTRIGISRAPDDGSELGRLISFASETVRRVKERGGARLQLYKKNADSAANMSFSLEALLHKAIMSESLEVHYQPQICLRTGRVHGLEALCRWRDKRTGLVEPGVFIPLAEETGLIDHLSAWLLRKVCLQIREWRDRNIAVPPVSVNLSPANFRDAGLPDRVLGWLRENRLDPEDIILELTESTLLDDDPVTLETVRTLQRLGMRLSMDDFGTGYSSLGYLRMLPFYEMKLDQSFVRDLDVNELSQRLSKAVIRIGESLNLCVVAEGVETEAQCRMLKYQHYHAAQGYFFARPMPPCDYEGWLAAWDQEAFTIAYL